MTREVFIKRAAEARAELVASLKSAVQAADQPVLEDGLIEGAILDALAALTEARTFTELAQEALPALSTEHA